MILQKIKLYQKAHFRVLGKPLLSSRVEKAAGKQSRSAGRALLDEHQRGALHAEAGDLTNFLISFPQGYRNDSKMQNKAYFVVSNVAFPWADITYANTINFNF